MSERASVRCCDLVFSRGMPSPSSDEFVEATNWHAKCSPQPTLMRALLVVEASHWIPPEEGGEGVAQTSLETFFNHTLSILLVVLLPVSSKASNTHTHTHTHRVRCGVGC